ncbi:hypothetical protein L1987_03894 [Smallanthus sonchifolius]|uniref:Uncharacterized protein n=1 Tax=Smallanthus sonchifolius TaxID=185202 RepID=A0ACB9KBY8_9ASTR|nr:hypothetical protein L1987_03894 [Smallanthus sonchifolius]
MDSEHVWCLDGSSEEEHKKNLQMRDLVEKQDSTSKLVVDFLTRISFAWIMFQDIATLLLDQKAFRYVVDIFVDRYRDKKISVVAGISIV